MKQEALIEEYETQIGEKLVKMASLHHESVAMTCNDEQAAPPRISAVIEDQAYDIWSLPLLIAVLWFVAPKVRNKKKHAENGNMQRQRQALTQEEIQQMLTEERQQTGLDKAPNPEITFFDEGEMPQNQVHVIWFPMLGKIRESTYDHGTTMRAALADLARQMKVAQSRLRCNLLGIDIDGEVPHVKRLVVHFFVGPPDPNRTRRPRRRRSPRPETESDEAEPWTIDTQGDVGQDEYGLDSDVKDEEPDNDQVNAIVATVSPTEPFGVDPETNQTDIDEESTDDIRDFFLQYVRQPEQETANHEYAHQHIANPEATAGNSAEDKDEPLEDEEPILPALEMIDCYEDLSECPPAQEEPCVIPVQHEGEQYTVKVNATATLEDLRWRLARQWGVLPSWLRMQRNGEDVDENVPCETFDGQELIAEMKVKIQRNEPPPRVHLRRRDGGRASSSTMPLQGGGSGHQVDALIDDDAKYRSALSRAGAVCRRLKKPQLKLLLRGDQALQKKVEQSDDASIIRMMEAAAKRVGMALHESSAVRATSEAPPIKSSEHAKPSHPSPPSPPGGKSDGNWVDIRDQ